MKYKSFFTALGVSIVLAVIWGSGSQMAAAVPLKAGLGNLIVNRSFEEGDFLPTAEPAGWTHDSFNASALFTWDDAHAYVGRKSIKITAATPNDASWLQTVPVQPHTTYILSGRIKTENVTPSAEAVVHSGASLALYGTWTHSKGVLGTQDWTYQSLVFNSGERTEVTVAARLGYWSGVTSGEAWFDGLQLMPLTRPSWKILVLIYEQTDLTYTDDNGVEHRVIASMTPYEKEQATNEATLFVNTDIPALTSGHMIPTLTIRYPDRVLDQLSRHGEGWWPGWWDIAPERDPAFDSIIVIWKAIGVDQTTGQEVFIGSAAGLAPNMGTGQTYAVIILDAAYTYGHRNVFKHEWGHCILEYFNETGIAPKPKVENHTTATQYVHCPTGEFYDWRDETLANPIPNSIYNNESGFTHDYYSGTTATADQPTRCLGITGEAWSMGGPVTKPFRPFFYDFVVQTPTVNQSGDPATELTYTVQVTNTGNMTDTVEISLDDYVWPSSMPSSVGPLAANAAASADLTVNVPPEAAAGATDTIRITLVSQGDSDQVVTKNLTTTANAKYSVWVTPTSTIKIGDAGTTVTHTLQLSNRGTIEDTFALAVEGAGWPTIIPPMVGPVAVGDAITLPVMVDIPTGAENGAADVANLTITSQGDISQTATLTLTTQVATMHRLFLPLIIK